MKKSPEVGLCVLLTPQGICSWGSFLGHPAEMEEQEAAVAPEPCWGTRSTAAPRDRHRAPAFKARVRCAEQEHRESWHCLKQSWGLAGESTAETNSRNLNRVRQLIQHGCGGEHKHPALESSRTDNGGCGRKKEGKFPVTGTGQGRLSAVRAEEGLTGCHGRGYKQNYHLPERSESMRTWGWSDGGWPTHRDLSNLHEAGSRINRFANQTVLNP